MSLINEALRKARKEAAERDAEERGVTYRPPRAHLPTERSWLPALAGVALGAVLAGVAFWLLLPRAEPSQKEPLQAEPAQTEAAQAQQAPQTETVPTESAEPPAGSVPQADSATPVVEPEPAPAPASSAPPPAPEPAPEPGPESPPEPTTAEPAQAEPERQPDLSTETQRVQPPEPAAQREGSNLSDATYILEANVDGIALRLDFIVWGSSPFAQINGNQVSVGQTVEGFIVREITREEVTLEGESESFRLRVR